MMYNKKQNFESQIEQLQVEVIEPESDSVQDEEVELDNYMEDGKSSICSSNESSSEDYHSSKDSQLSDDKSKKTVRYDSKTKIYHLIPRVFRDILDSEIDANSQVSNKTLKRYLNHKQK